MVPELMRKRIVKRYARIVRPPESPPLPIKTASTKDLEKLLNTINCFLSSEPENPEPGTPYSEGYILLRQDLEKRLHDARFAGYGWHIKKYQIVLDENLQAIADKARVDIRAVLKFRETKEKGYVETRPDKRKAVNRQERTGEDAVRAS